MTFPCPSSARKCYMMPVYLHASALRMWRGMVGVNPVRRIREFVCFIHDPAYVNERGNAFMASIFWVQQRPEKANDNGIQ